MKVFSILIWFFHRAFPNYGSVMWLLVHVLLPGTAEENLAKIWGDIVRLYDEFGILNRYWVIRRSMFNTKAQPKMKGKAAEVKDLLPVLVSVWKKYYNPDLDIHRKILVVMQGSCHMDDLLSQHPADYALPSDVADDLLATCCITLSTWRKVFPHFKKEKVQPPLFGLIAKARLLMHCCVLSR